MGYLMLKFDLFNCNQYIFNVPLHIFVNNLLFALIYMVSSIPINTNDLYTIIWFKVTITI